jgi:pyruvate formate lyase activating enzyme
MEKQFLSTPSRDIEATLFSVQKFSTEDGPGIRTTVFFKGCPMRCPWCHNPESIRREPEVVWHAGRCLDDLGCIDTCPEKVLCREEQGIVLDRSRCAGCGRCVDFCAASALELHGRTTPVGALFDQVVRDAPFYESSDGGVTLSGGEPLAQPEAAIALMRLLKDAGVHIALDTCGAVSERALGQALELVDMVLFDVKSVDPERHLELTGVAFDRVCTSAKQVEAAGVPVWVRTPIIPGFNDDEQSVRDVARFVAETFNNCERHDLLAFSNLCISKYEQLGKVFPLAEAPLLKGETMDRLCEIARQAGSRHVRWSGATQLKESET